MSTPKQHSANGVSMRIVGVLEKNNWATSTNNNSTSLVGGMAEVWETN
jgi:hypothetical protein